jgi:hypothetical protein
MYTGPKIVTNGLILYLDAGNTKSYPISGTTWSDLTNNSFDATLFNSPTFNSSNCGNITFDGLNQYANLGNISQIAPGSGDFTICFWINPTNWSSTYSPLFTTTTTNGLWISKNQSNFVLRAYNVADDLQYSTFPTTNTWTYITITRSGTNANIYYNTTSVVNNVVTRNYVTGTSEICRDGTANVFTGKLSIVKYYNKALTSTEILQNYNATKSRFGL